MANTSLLGSYSGQDNSALMFRNRIINGDMRISQRYDNVAAHTITAGSIFYTIDRFFVFATGANVTGQRIAGTGANPYVYRVTGAASNTQCLLIQRIEAANTEDLVNKTVTLQFEASAAVITSLDYDIRVPSARDNFNTTTSVTSGTVTVSTTPTIFTVTCTLPANAANGVQINLGKTAGLVASQTFSISGVQLEAGPVATPFERRPIGTELALCQRYYHKISGSVWATTAHTRSPDTVGYLGVALPVNPRGSVTFTASANGTNSFYGAAAIATMTTVSSFTIGNASGNMLWCPVTVTTGIGTYKPAICELTSFEMSSEL